ncbi:hypothetical protein KP509_10G044100 [Ceratopteris richardii]|uniref:Protein kinase domain-containing protein n=1 Tax=Ceratopteris richardii TaxID=49495 RepID=A0A8T2TYS7_CERRI|nr:hypothetical protein KP509_10G044100 [Ceratopteris richardii]
MLTGSVPESLLQIRMLKSLDISFNRLEGNVSLLNQVTNKIDVNPIWNLLNGTLSLHGMKSALPLLDCVSNMTCGYSKDENFNFAINAGGPAYYGTSVTYDADDETTSVYVAPNNVWLMSSSGGTRPLISAAGIIGANGSVPLRSARQALSSLRYFGLGISNDLYTVELQFSEILFGDGTVGRRIFDVYIQGIPVLRNFDIQKTANGSNRPITKKFPANVSNNILDIHFFWAGKGTCCVPDGSQDYGALVSAIYVYSGFSPENNVDGLSSKKTGFTSFEGTPVVFSLSDLQNATNGFHAECKLGEGGFGSVYKGLLADGSYAAVKVLSAASLQGQQEFMNEVNLITAVQHRNLVKLKGCCLEQGQAILVYEFLENGSLDMNLFGQESNSLGWGTRFEIILGIARGITYLHEECQTPIIHRDIKEPGTHCSEKGFFKGYMAPEYAFRGKLTVKADVYSFGVLALEIVSGRRIQDSKESEEKEFLIDWAWSLHEQDGILGIIDPLLQGYQEEEVLRTIYVAMLCALPVAQLRPMMSRAVSMLLGDAEVTPLPPKLDYLGVPMWRYKQNLRTQNETSTSSSHRSSFYSSSYTKSDSLLLSGLAGPR